MTRRRQTTRLEPPFLKRIWLPDAPPTTDSDETSQSEAEGQAAEAAYPFNLPLFQRGQFELGFHSPVTILVGENGSGKSTLLEAIAHLAGFGEGGGGYGHRAVSAQSTSGQDGGSLGAALRAAWLPKLGYGFFFRAETFFSVARYLDDAGSPAADFLSHSHGEGFLRFFEERADRQGIYLFDEPESALSPTRQFEFLRLLHRINLGRQSQIIMATHSPILMALPNADLLRLDRHALTPTTLEETDHYRVYREFILYPHATVEAMVE